MGNWVKYLEKITEINIQLPVLLASWLAIFFQKKSILEFGVFLPLLSFLAVFSSIAVILIASLKSFNFIKLFARKFLQKKATEKRNKKILKEF